MFGIDVSTVAIECAKKQGTLTLKPFTTRFDTTAWAVSDDHGLICVETTKTEAVRRCFGPTAGPGSFRRLVQQHKEEL